MTSQELECILDRLFTNGAGEKADRLVLTVDGPLRRDLGGWSRAGASAAIVAGLAAAVQGAAAGPERS